jgi:hypothetical protein
MGDSEKGLRTRALIAPGIFTAPFFIVAFAFALVLHGLPVLSLFTAGARPADFIRGQGAYKNFWPNAAGCVVLIPGLALDGYAPMPIFSAALAALLTGRPLRPKHFQKVGMP